MHTEDLKKLRELKKGIMASRQGENERKQKLQQLLKEQSVQEFLRLSGLKFDMDLNVPGENEIVEEIIKDYKFEPDDANKIYYCDSADSEYLIANQLYGIDRWVGEKYVIYANLERPADHWYTLMEDRDKFEANHQVVYGHTQGTEAIGYDEMRNEYFTLAINNGQKEAVQKILKKYGKSKGKTK